MRHSELRALSIQNLEERVSAERLAYQKMKLAHRVTPMDRPSMLTEKRREVALLMTILEEKRREESLNSDDKE
ncbi:MAG: uL29 family ribosomal protein [Porphyromonas sp.]|nr:uL29 family ribosomal protein [Porphyromonas sp.]